MEQEKTTKLTREEYERAAVYSLWRLFQAVIIIPGTIAAMVFMTLAIAEKQPIQHLRLFVYHQYVKLNAGEEPARHQAGDKLDSREGTAMEEFPMVEAVDHAIEELKVWWGFIALGSLWILYTMKPGKQFFGLAGPGKMISRPAIFKSEEGRTSGQKP